MSSDLPATSGSLMPSTLTTDVPAMQPNPFPLLRLPGEIRNRIYKFLFASGSIYQIHIRSLRKQQKKNWHVTWSTKNTAIILVCRQLYSELGLFARESTHFVVCSRLSFNSARVMRPLATAIGTSILKLWLHPAYITVEQINKLFPNLQKLRMCTGHVLLSPPGRHHENADNADSSYWMQVYERILFPANLMGSLPLPWIRRIRAIWTDQRRDFDFQHWLFIRSVPGNLPHLVCCPSASRNIINPPSDSSNSVQPYEETITPSTSGISTLLAMMDQ